MSTPWRAWGISIEAGIVGWSWFDFPAQHYGPALFRTRSEARAVAKKHMAALMPWRVAMRVVRVTVQEEVNP